MTPIQIALILLLGIAAPLLSGIAVWQGMRVRLREMRTRNTQLTRQLQDCEARTAQTDTLAVLSEVCSNALLLLDEERRIVRMNGAAQRLFGHDTLVPAKSDGTLISVTRHHELDDLAEQTLTSGEGVEYQLAIDGRTYHVRTQLSGTESEPLVAMALQDISELQRLGRARRDMVANVSHELRTPITSIRLLVDTLKRDDPSKSAHDQALLQKITDETDTLQQIAQELLDLAMIESGRAEFIMKPVPARAIIEQTVEHFTEQAQRNNLTIEIRAEPELVALADAQQTERVLGNLLHNSIKFTPGGGQIVISVEPSDNWLTFCVTDTGPGIPPDERNRVFERFYRADRARRGSGTGLGLAIAKHIVQSHGGQIWAEEPPGSRGARICFTLPTPEE